MNDNRDKCRTQHFPTIYICIYECTTIEELLVGSNRTGEREQETFVG